MSHLVHAVLDAVTRAISRSERVHFHTGDHGRPYICEFQRCNSPALDIAHR